MTIARQPISPGQIKAIHALVGRLGWDDDMYRLMLQERYQVATCKALSRIQAGLLLDELAQKQAVGCRPKAEGSRKAHAWPAPQRPARAGGTITEKQQRHLERLFARLGWDQARRDGLCRKLLGKAWPQTNGDVNKLLRVLLPMVRRYPTGYDRARGG